MLQIIGLILDIIGVGLLFAGTEIMNTAMLKLIELLKNTTGYLVDDNFFKEKAELTKQSEIKKNISNFLSRIGLVFLILGFIFQLITAIKQY